MSLECYMNRTMVDLFVDSLWKNHGRLQFAGEGRCADWYTIDNEFVLN